MNTILLIAQTALAASLVPAGILKTPRHESLHAGVVQLLAGAGSSPRKPVDVNLDEPEGKRFLLLVDSLYAQRADLAPLRKAIQLLVQARALQPDNYDLNWRLAKFNYYLAGHTPDKSERNSALKAGSEAGLASVRLRPQEPAGHFWLGANWGERARTQGALKALGSVEDVQREMETVIKLNEAYQDGSAYMVLGQIDLSLPGFLGGSKKRAVERLEKGLVFGKRNAFLRLRLAEAYLAVKRSKEAREQLAGILSMGAAPDYQPEYEEAVAAARRLLAEMSR